ncbi:hypothetical protein ACIG56_00075 [Nocardia fusca]
MTPSAEHHPLRSEASYLRELRPSLADLGDTRTTLTKGLAAVSVVEGS